MPKMVIEVPEEFTEVGKALAEHLKIGSKRSARHRFASITQGVDEVLGAGPMDARGRDCARDCPR